MGAPRPREGRDGAEVIQCPGAFLSRLLPGPDSFINLAPSWPQMAAWLVCRDMGLGGVLYVKITGFLNYPLCLYCSTPSEEAHTGYLSCILLCQQRALWCRAEPLLGPSGTSVWILVQQAGNGGGGSLLTPLLWRSLHPSPGA